MSHAAVSSERHRRDARTSTPYSSGTAAWEPNTHPASAEVESRLATQGTFRADRVNTLL